VATRYKEPDLKIPKNPANLNRFDECNFAPFPLAPFLPFPFIDE
jgi:hypothetical protein